ncbi:hypothetical protein C8R44DRAFT_747630 [Mycena epipterygia]|nr:hypothetical protein C8R44DRAFT_747630 [Mycena epipterygia]
MSLVLLALLPCLLFTAPRVAGSNPKRGLSLVQGSESDLVKANGGDCSWFYNWAPTPPASLPAVNLDFIPMQWGSGDIEGFADTVRAGGWSTILAFNEPNEPAQSNIPAAEAAQLWQQYIQPLKGNGVRLGSPAISSGPNGLPWLADFTSQCTGCTIDFIVVHWYGMGAGNLINYLESVHAQFPYQPIWITEFAETSFDAGGELRALPSSNRNTCVLTGSRSAEIASFMATTLAFLDAQPWIEGYSWFAYASSLSGLQSNLLDGAGNLNALGSSYIAGPNGRRGHHARRTQRRNIA